MNILRKYQSVKGKQIKYLNLKGSQTVEIAIVFPIVLFVVVSVMYLAFYIHDMIKLGSCAYSSALESVFEETSCHDTAKEQLANLKLFCIRPSSVWTEEHGSFHVKYKGDFIVPFTGLSLFLQAEKIEVERRTVGKMNIKYMYAINAAKKLLEEETK